MSYELTKTVEGLYTVFVRYALDPHMEGSPSYAELAKWNQILAAQPLRNLSKDDLSIFYFKAMSTWGKVEDFKHFLPRIFELLTTFPHDWEVWVAFDKLNYGGWQTWSKQEQEAIRQYLLAFWQELLDTDSGKATACFQDYFPALAHVYFDFEHMLHLWLASTSESSARHLVNFVYYNAESLLRKKILPGLYASEVKGKSFYQWLTSEAVVSKLEDAFFDSGTQDIAEQLSVTLQLIECSRV